MEYITDVFARPSSFVKHESTRLDIRADAAVDHGGCRKELKAISFLGSAEKKRRDCHYFQELL
jgi:hypothetical protein